MRESPYCSLFDLSPNPTPEELKRAYHEQAKKNHPDLFPEQERHLQQLKMMKINEAYLVLSQEIEQQGYNGGALRAKEGETPETEPERKTTPGPMGGTFSGEEEIPPTAVGHLKDPAYTYYKLGFEYYKRGYSSLYQRICQNISQALKRKSTSPLL